MAKSTRPTLERSSDVGRGHVLGLTVDYGGDPADVTAACPACRIADAIRTVIGHLDNDCNENSTTMTKRHPSTASSDAATSAPKFLDLLPVVFRLSLVAVPVDFVVAVLMLSAATPARGDFELTAAADKTLLRFPRGSSVAILADDYGDDNKGRSLDQVSSAASYFEGE